MAGSYKVTVQVRKEGVGARHAGENKAWIFPFWPDSELAAANEDATWSSAY